MKNLGGFFVRAGLKIKISACTDVNKHLIELQKKQLDFIIVWCFCSFIHCLVQLLTGATFVVFTHLHPKQADRSVLHPMLRQQI